MKYTLIIVITLFFVSGCSSIPKQPPIDPVIDRVEGAQMIKDKDTKEVILVSETSGERELKESIWKNTDTEKEIVVKIDHINNCRKIMSDTRLGGNGDYTEAEALVIKKHELNRKYDKEGFKFTTKETFDERLAYEKEYGKSLDESFVDLSNQEKRCVKELRIVRAKKNLLREEEIDSAETSTAQHHRNLRDLASDKK